MIVFGGKFMENRADNYNNIKKVNGERYIACGLKTGRITVEGIVGNDCAAFMDGAAMEIYGNAQDGLGNTMNNGYVIVHGHAGDIVGYSMRGGNIFIRDYAGYRIGIHMKEYKDRIPCIVIGETVGEFLGEYMAGGVIAVLNKNSKEDPAGDHIAPGMHGGVIYIKGKVVEYKLSPQIKTEVLNDYDISILNNLIYKYEEQFHLSLSRNYNEYIKIVPKNSRPYGKFFI